MCVTMTKLVLRFYATLHNVLFEKCCFLLVHNEWSLWSLRFVNGVFSFSLIHWPCFSTAYLLMWRHLDVILSHFGRFFHIFLCRVRCFFRNGKLDIFLYMLKTEMWIKLHLVAHACMRETSINFNSRASRCVLAEANLLFRRLFL